ncbi:MAG: IMPACT family protein [Cellvibrionaceae bacterium]|nr:IMPACT family protein [Cellvibrionaceae bacterium]
MKKPFLTPETSASIEVEVNKSRFLTEAHPVASRAELQAHLARAKQRYPDASHHCWAYLVGDVDTPTEMAASDDGEPRGTAGQPMLSALRAKRVGCCGVIISRYFGGIKLGAGGLIRAYSGATSRLLEQINLIEFEYRWRGMVHADFAHEQRLRAWLAEHGGICESVNYSSGTDMTVSLGEKNVTAFTEFCRALKIQHKTLGKR